MELAKHGCEATPVEEQHVAGQQTCFLAGCECFSHASTQHSEHDRM